MTEETPEYGFVNRGQSLFRKLNWTPETKASLDELPEDIQQAFHRGIQHYDEYKYEDSRAKESKKRADKELQRALPFFPDGKAKAEEGSFVFTTLPGRKSVNIEKLKQWLVMHGVDAALVIQGIEECTTEGQPTSFVKWQPARRKQERK